METGPCLDLRGYRERAGLSQVELSKRTGIAQSSICNMEAGRAPIGWKSAKTLAKALHIDHRQILTTEGKRMKSLEEMLTIGYRDFSE